MKKRVKVAVLSLVGVLALGGTATAIAFSVTAAKKNGSANVENEYLNLSFNNKEATFDAISIARGETLKKEINVKIDKRAADPGIYDLVYTYNEPSDVTIAIYNVDPDLETGVKPVPLATLKKGVLTISKVEVPLDRDVFTSYVQFICPNEAVTIGGRLNVRLASRV